MKRHSSRKPIKQRDIRRYPCARCGRPSTQQWQICALNNRWYGLCDKCDVLLNKLVLKWTSRKGWKQLWKAYKRSVRRG